MVLALLLSLAQAELRVGLSAHDMTPPLGVPVVGHTGADKRHLFPDILNRHPYQFFFKGAEGIIDPIRAKAMVLRNGDQTLAFLSIDMIAVTADVVEDILGRVSDLGIGPNDLLVSATHTHNGPGASSRNLFWQLLAMDLFEEEVYEGVVSHMAAAIREAYGKAEPAELVTSTFEVRGVQANRRRKPGNFDPTAHMLVARSVSGRWLGGLVNFAVHGLAIPFDDVRFSADINGAIEHQLELVYAQKNGAPEGNTDGVVFVYQNGAEGDVKPRERGLDRMAEQAGKFREAAEAATFLPVAGEWEVQSQEVELGGGFPNIIGCFKQEEQGPPVEEGLRGFHEEQHNSMKSFIRKRGATVMSWLANLWLPTRSKIWSVNLGGMKMMTFPGEATTNLGLDLRARALAAGASSAWVLGLTNDHLAYFTTPEQYEEGGYESCATMYGADVGVNMISQHESMF